MWVRGKSRYLFLFLFKKKVAARSLKQKSWKTSDGRKAGRERSKAAWIADGELDPSSEGLSFLLTHWLGRMLVRWQIQFEAW